MNEFERAVKECRNCAVYDPRHYDQWVRKLGEGFLVHTLRSGMTMRMVPGTPEVPIWWDYVLCREHLAIAEADED